MDGQAVVGFPAKSVETSSRSGRQIWVDVLRGVAVLLVLFCHTKQDLPVGTIPFLPRVLLALQAGGAVGVELFFILSGFLVSGILFRQYLLTGEVRPVQFLIRRGFKIYPPLWALLAVTLVYVWFTTHRLPLRNIVVELLFLQNYTSGLYVHTWSLGVEEHCYIALCLILSCMALLAGDGTNPFRYYPLVASSGIVLSLAYRSLDLSPVTAQNFLQRVTPTHLRCGAFLTGTLLGYDYYFHNQRLVEWCRQYRMTVFVIGTALILPVFSADLDAIGGPGMLWFWLTPVGGSLLLLSALATHASPGWVARQVALIGRHSYSIYLWHILVGILWLNALCGQLGLRLTLPIWVACYLVLSIGSGMVMTHLIEIPALWLRDRWCPDTSRTKRDSAVALTERQAA